jgi:hypothetical protein
MKHSRRTRILLFAALLLTASACEKKKPPAVQVVHTEPVVSPVGTSQTILQKTFSMKSAATFPFEIPAHAVRPHLHGIFASFIREVHVGSEDSANVDFLILNADQYADFAANRPGETLFFVESSHNQSVNVDLPASYDQPVKYYLAFRDAAHGARSKVVEADFHVDF